MVVRSEVAGDDEMPVISWNDVEEIDDNDDENAIEGGNVFDLNSHLAQIAALHYSRPLQGLVLTFLFQMRMLIAINEEVEKMLNQIRCASKQPRSLHEKRY